MTDIYDIAIAGGGPAGTSAAISAVRSGARVILLERGIFPREKVCGEFVSAESLELLRDLLGSAHPLLSGSVELANARLFIDGRILRSKIAPAARSIPRFQMDDALWQAAQTAGVECHQRTAVGEITGNGPFVIRTDRGDFHAHAVVVAAGRWSNLGQRPAANDGRIGIKAHFREETTAPPSIDLYFFPGGYCGVQPMGRGEINVSAMVMAQTARTLDEVFAQEPRLQSRSRSWQRMTEPVTTSPLGFGRPMPVEGNILRVGDAAGFVDPFVGDGISMALHAGAMASTCLSEFLRGHRTLEQAAGAYQAGYEERLLPVFRNAGRVRGLLNAPRLVRLTALSLLRSERLTELIVKKTRARIA